MANCVQEVEQFVELDTKVLFPVMRMFREPLDEILNKAKVEFEVDGAAAVFSTWRLEEDAPSWQLTDR